MFYGILIFVTIFYLFLFSFHCVFYTFLKYFFDITKRSIRRFLFYVVSFLSASFILVIFLSRIFDNIFIRIAYVFSAFWLGAIINLFLFSVIAFLLDYILRFFKFKYNKKVIGIIFLFLAIIYSVYGYCNAISPVVKNIEVEIENLPAEWQGKTIVHISDVHLGLVHGQRLANKLVKKINKVNPEAVFITGDLFDGMDSFKFEMIEPFKDIQSKHGTYFVTGNHELYLEYAPLELLQDAKIQHLSNQLINIDDLQVIGIDYGFSKAGEKLSEIIENKNSYNKELPTVLLYHTPTNIITHDDSDKHFNAYFNPDTDLSHVESSGIDLQLSGHTHNGQMIPFNFLTKWIFNDFDYGLRKNNGFSIYTTSGVGTWGPLMRTGSRAEIVAITFR